MSDKKGAQDDKDVIELMQDKKELLRLNQIFRPRVFDKNQWAHGDPDMNPGHYELDIEMTAENTGPSVNRPVGEFFSPTGTRQRPSISEPARNWWEQWNKAVKEMDALVDKYNNKQEDWQWDTFVSEYLVVCEPIIQRVLETASNADRNALFSFEESTTALYLLMPWKWVKNHGYVLACFPDRQVFSTKQVHATELRTVILPEVLRRYYNIFSRMTRVALNKDGKLSVVGSENKADGQVKEAIAIATQVDSPKEKEEQERLARVVTAMQKEILGQADLGKSPAELDRQLKNRMLVDMRERVLAIARTVAPPSPQCCCRCCGCCDCCCAPNCCGCCTMGCVGSFISYVLGLFIYPLFLAIRLVSIGCENLRESPDEASKRCRNLFLFLALIVVLPIYLVLVTLPLILLYLGLGSVFIYHYAEFYSLTPNDSNPAMGFRHNANFLEAYVPAALVLTLVYVYWEQLTQVFGADFKALFSSSNAKASANKSGRGKIDRTGYGPTEDNYLFSGMNIARAKQRFDQLFLRSLRDPQGRREVPVADQAEYVIRHIRRREARRIASDCCIWYRGVFLYVILPVGIAAVHCLIPGIVRYAQGDPWAGDSWPDYLIYTFNVIVCFPGLLLVLSQFAVLVQDFDTQFTIYNGIRMVVDSSQAAYLGLTHYVELLDKRNLVGWLLFRQIIRSRVQNRLDTMALARNKLLAPIIILGLALGVTLGIKIIREGVVFDVFNVLAAYDVLLIGVYTVWVLLEAVAANEALSGHVGILHGRRSKLAEELCDETDPKLRERLRDQDVLLQSAIGRVGSVDEAIKIFSLRIDRAFVNRVILSFATALIGYVSQFLSYLQ